MSYGFVSFVLVFLVLWALVIFLIAAEAAAEEACYQQKGGGYASCRGRPPGLEPGLPRQQ